LAAHGPAAFLVLAGSACSILPPAPAASSWEARLADAQVAQAESLAAAAPGPPGPVRRDAHPGRPAEGAASGPADDAPRRAALAAARAALAAARQAAYPAASARALLLIGHLDGDLGASTEALSLFRGLGDADGVTKARLQLAELAVGAGQPTAALGWLAPLQADPAAAPEGDSPLGRQQIALAAARIHHLQAAALRQQGRRADALSRERRASIALSLLPDDQQLPLRLGVTQALGDDHAGAADFQRALEQHARAASLSRALGDARAELAALAGLCGDLAGLGRFKDAADHCTRALALAQELHDRTRARDLALAGLALLGAMGEPHTTDRWRAFDAAAR